jgi:uncharacterized membrane protein YhaH (DUF805 family)
VIYSAAVYILLCLLVGFIGRWSRLGFWGVVLVSIALTPLVTGLCLVFLSDRTRPITTPARLFAARFKR